MLAVGGLATSPAFSTALPLPLRRYHLHPALPAALESVAGGGEGGEVAAAAAVVTQEEEVAAALSCITASISAWSTCQRAAIKSSFKGQDIGGGVTFAADGGQQQQHPSEKGHPLLDLLAPFSSPSPSPSLSSFGPQGGSAG